MKRIGTYLATAAGVGLLALGGGISVASATSYTSAPAVVRAGYDSDKNHPEYWEAYLENMGYTNVTCTKLSEEPYEGDAEIYTYTADKAYALVVLKNSTYNDLHWNVAAGATVGTAMHDGKRHAISHVIVCNGTPPMTSTTTTTTVPTTDTTTTTTVPTTDTTTTTTVPTTDTTTTTTTVPTVTVTETVTVTVTGTETVTDTVTDTVTVTDTATETVTDTVTVTVTVTETPGQGSETLTSTTDATTTTTTGTETETPGQGTLTMTTVPTTETQGRGDGGATGPVVETDDLGGGSSSFLGGLAVMLMGAALTLLGLRRQSSEH